MGLNRPTLIVFGLFYLCLLLGIAYLALWLQDEHIHEHLWASAVQGIDPSQVYTLSRGVDAHESFRLWETSMPFLHRTLYTLAFWAGCWWRIMEGVGYLIVTFGERKWWMHIAKNFVLLGMPFLSMRF